MNHLTIFTTTVKEFRVEAEIFYQLCQRETTLDSANTLVVAKLADLVVGIVRLCQEHGVYVLRTMQVHPSYQRQNVGSKMLQNFEALLNEKRIRETFCMPYAHLEAFYNGIGFKKIVEPSAPLFLQDRIASTRLKKPDELVILMKR